MVITKTTEERYNDMLEVLPPQAHEAGAFLVGEASGAKEGGQTFASFFTIAGEYYEGEAITEDEFKAFLLLEDAEKLADEGEPEGEIAEELKLLETYNAEAIKAYKYLGLGGLDNFEEAYIGQYDSDKAFAMEMHEQTGEAIANTWPHNCIDWERASRDLMYDYTEEGGYYFRNL